MSNIEKKNYSQIINYLENKQILDNKLIYKALIDRLNKWDKALMWHSRFDYVGNIHLKKFKPYLDEINLPFLDDILCMDIPEYNFYVTSKESENFGLIGRIFQSMTHWKVLYFTNDLLCLFNAYPRQKLLEIWIIESIIDGRVSRNKDKVNIEEAQDRLENYLNSDSWCQFFFEGFRRPIVLLEPNA